MKKLMFAAILVATAAAGWFTYPRWLPWLQPIAPSLVARLAPSAADQKTAADQGKGGGKADQPVAVKLATAEAKTLPLIERTYGIVQSPKIATIGAQIASQIREVKVKDGQDVKTGDVLVVLDDRALQAQLAKDQAQLAKDQATAASNHLDLQRAQALVQKQAGTQQAYDQAVATAKAADAMVEADQAAIAADQVQISYTIIKAPIDGRLGAVQAMTGNLTSTGSSAAPLMTITEIHPLKVTFQLPEVLLGPIRQRLASNLPITVQVLRSGTDEALDEGRLDFVDSAIDSTSGTITMSATLDNAKLSLWPGEHVDVAVNRGSVGPMAVVPTVAVQMGQNGAFVWLVKDDKTVEARNVEVARNDAGLAAIASGLKPGDKVVIEGQLRLKPGAAVKTGDKAQGEKPKTTAAADSSAAGTPDQKASE